MKDYKIKKGDKFLCKETLYKGRDEKVAYLRGETYTSEKDGCLLDEEGERTYWTENHPSFSKHFAPLLEMKPKYTGVIQGIKKSESFYMVIVEGSTIAPKVKHVDYDIAFQECLRLSKQGGKTAYVLEAITEVEQIPNVKQLLRKKD